MPLILAVLLATVATPPLGGTGAASARLSDTGIFTALAGTWSGSGTLMGRPASFRMSWELHGELAILQFENAHVAEDGTLRPVLSAAAVYRVTGAPEGVWLDSRGARIEIRWTATDDALISTWSGTGESGRTTYRVVSSDRVEVVDEVAVADGWREFARATYDRTGPAAASGL